MSESGILYLVPNKHGPGKTLVRRPKPPPTSTPLDEEFDAATQARPDRDGCEEYDNETAPPLNDDFDAYTQDRATTRGWETPWSDRHRRRVSLQSSAPISELVPLTPPKDVIPSPADGLFCDERPGTCPQETYSHVGGFDNYGEYGQYMEEVEKMFGTNVDLELSMKGSKHSVKGLDRQVGATRSVSGSSTRRNSSRSLRPMDDRSRYTTGSTNNLMVENVNIPRPKFEMVKRRVLEDSPEKTVTISTWREQVAQEARTEAVMDVYYVTASDYVEHDDQMPEVDYESKRRSRLLTTKNKDSMGLDRPLPAVGRRRSVIEESFSAGKQLLSDTLHHSPSRAVASDHSVESQRHDPVTRYEEYYEAYIAPHSSTPFNKRRTRGSPSPKTHEATRLGTKQSVSPTSRHNRSRSTDSSFQGGAPAIPIRNILTSCRPSLLHIAPVLASLGITTEEHLRAVARLSEETRDKEVKEEALKLGVTVVEWAILLDRLQTL